MTHTPITPIEILLVEDNEPDVLLTQEAFEDARIANNLHVTRDGVEAMAYLRRLPPFEQAPTPDVVLLDINMPGGTGLSVLQKLKQSSKTMFVPVVVLSGNVDPEMPAHVVALGAAKFLSKPIEPEALLQAVLDAAK